MIGTICNIFILGAKEALENDECPVGSIYDYNYAQKFNDIV